MAIKRVTKVQQLFDESSDTWFDIYKAPCVGKSTVVVEIPRAERSVKLVRKHLLSKGVTIAATSDDEELLATIESEPPIVHRALKTGWRRPGTTFVYPSYVVGSSDEVEVVPPSYLTILDGKVALKGTCQAWQELAKIARYSTTMTVCLSAAFAAPLISLLNRPSFALVLVGPSRCGKSTAQVLAASVLGFGAEEDLPSLNATSAGLLALAINFNDLLLPINEVGSARRSKDEIYVVLRDATYALMNGQDTIRHPSWRAGNASGSNTFKVLCLLSSEISPDAWAARNAQTRDDGEMARLIGLPVALSPSNTIFDRAPEMEEAELRSWERAQFEAIRAAVPKARGWAFKRFLEALPADDGTATRAATLAQYFENKIGKHAKSAVEHDIVAKFAIVYAGGVIASELGVLPLKPARIFNAVRGGCLSALRELPDHDAQLASDLLKLQEKLATGGVIALETASSKTLGRIQSAEGFSRRKERGREYILRSERFPDNFVTVLRTRRVLEWLDNEGLLAHSRERTMTRSLEWAQKQVSWPGGLRVRSIVIYLPDGFLFPNSPSNLI